MKRVVLLLVALVAGCVGGEPGDATPPTPTPAPGAAAQPGEPVFAFDAPRCEEANAIFFLDPEEAARLLPEGFRPADSVSLFGLPPASGKATLLYAVIACPESSVGATAEANVAVFVEPPEVENAPAATPYQFYEIHRYVKPGPAADALARVQWSHDVADVKVRSSTTEASGRVETLEAAVASIHARVAPAGYSFPQSVARFWHQTPSGLAYIEYELAATIYSGAGECTFAADSPFAAAAGATACSPDRAIGATWSPYALETRLYLHGGGTG